MSDKSDSSMFKYAMIGLGALAVAGIAYYLSQDADALDYKEYTKEKLETLMKEVQLELTGFLSNSLPLPLSPRFLRPPLLPLSERDVERPDTERAHVADSSVVLLLVQSLQRKGVIIGWWVV